MPFARGVMPPPRSSFARSRVLELAPSAVSATTSATGTPLVVSPLMIDRVTQTEVLALCGLSTLDKNRVFCQGVVAAGDDQHAIGQHRDAAGLYPLVFSELGAPRDQIPSLAKSQLTLSLGIEQGNWAPRRVLARKV